MATFLGDLADAVDDHILTEAEATLRYRSDWTGRWVGDAIAVVRPVSIEQVVDAVRVCRVHDVPIVPQGGNTGMVGGAVPFTGSVVLSTGSLVGIGQLDENDSTVTAGAGVTLCELQEFARSHGLSTGLDIASSQSATVGGLASTNAGGARVMRYGSARACIAGLRVVSPSAEVIDRLHALPKDNTGLDLLDLYIGAEGTLGIITDVKWRLVPRNATTVVTVFRFPDVTAAVSALPTLRALPGVEALEWARGVDVVRVAQHVGSALPLRSDGFWVFAEMGDSGFTRAGDESVDLLDLAEPVIARLVETTAVTDDDVAIAHSINEQRALWALRERMSESIATEGVPIKLDVAVPIGKFAETCDAVDSIVQKVHPSARTAMFGHFSEGNFHISVLPPIGVRQLDEEIADEVEDAILACIVDAGGTISAEHGVGRAKQRWLLRQRGEAQYSTMAAIKNAIDPRRLLNPGVLFSRTDQEELSK